MNTYETLDALAADFHIGRAYRVEIGGKSAAVIVEGFAYSGDDPENETPHLVISDHEGRVGHAHPSEAHDDLDDDQAVYLGLLSLIRNGAL